MRLPHCFLWFPNSVSKTVSQPGFSHGFSTRFHNRFLAWFLNPVPRPSFSIRFLIRYAETLVRLPHCFLCFVNPVSQLGFSIRFLNRLFNLASHPVSHPVPRPGFSIRSLIRYAETLVRLPHCFLCYTPPAHMPQVPPTLTVGPIVLVQHTLLEVRLPHA